jgi:hypothetical protein
MRRKSQSFAAPRLFEMPAEPGRVADVRWSYSRRSTLETCPRKYYFEYYGGNRSVALADPTKADLTFLKGVQNRFQRTGEILHQTIARYLRGIQKDELLTEESLAAWSQRRFQDDRRYSSSFAIGRDDPPDQDNGHALLHEFIYHFPDALELCDEMERRMLAAFHACVMEAGFGAFRLGASNPAALIERRFTLTGLPCRVEGMIDLAYPVGERVVIVDWKLGGDTGSGTDSLQLAVYALWAASHFDRAPEAIDVYRAHLSSGEVVAFPLDRRVLAAARARIVQDAMTMATLERYGVEGVAEAFTPRIEPSICRQCQFVRACPAGQEVVDA